MNFRSNSGSVLRPSSPTRPTQTAVAGPGKTTTASSTASSGDSTRLPPGVISLSVTALGKPSTVVSDAGGRTALGRRSSPTFSTTLSAEVAWATNSGWSMPPSSAPAALPVGRKKNPDEVPILGGPKPAQLIEPSKQALGCSQGGFGTKVNLLASDRGVVLGIHGIPSQRHESV